MSLEDLLVVVPHSGIIIPGEIPADSLSENLPQLVRNTDWYTNWLYDFRDILDNRHLVFPYCSLILEANRHPDKLDDCVPLLDVFGEAIYRQGKEPSEALRKSMVSKYLAPFHQSIGKAIASGAEFLLDGHSTVPARGVGDNQIELMNFQHSSLDDGPRKYSPDVYIETYAKELRARLPDVEVTVNASEYYTVYGHVCAHHSVNALGRVGRRVPAIIQETNERLYKNPDHTPNVEALDRLRRAFAESLRSMLRKVQGLNRATTMIELHSLRQTYDFDCGVKALQTVMAHYGVEVREDKLLLETDTDKREGTRFKKMIAVAEARGFRVEAGENWTIDILKHHISQGNPVIVLLQAWAEEYKNLKDWRADYDDGHYATVIGYNKDVIFFEDPSSFHRTWLKEKEFLARWHDRDPFTKEKLERFGMVLLGREPVGRLLQHME